MAKVFCHSLFQGKRIKVRTLSRVSLWGSAMKNKIKSCSLFSGCGGLDLGFKRAGYDIVYANEFDKFIWETFEHNNPGTCLDKRSIVDVTADDIPEGIDMLIGGPPCQAYSESGMKRGESDERGRLFFEYTRLLREIKPKVCLAENVRGILTKRHEATYEKIIKEYDEAGYDLHFFKFQLSDFGIPQDRERVFFIGTRKDLGIKSLRLDLPKLPRKTLFDAIGDLDGSAVPFGESVRMSNHHYYVENYSSMYMSRSRVRGWGDVSFTIQASARHAPQHPSIEMIRINSQSFKFNDEKNQRLSVRECARIQTFPDDFEFFYSNIRHAYKMVGNAVPPDFAELIAVQIRKKCFNYI